MDKRIKKKMVMIEWYDPTFHQGGNAADKSLSFTKWTSIGFLASERTINGIECVVLATSWLAPDNSVSGPGLRFGYEEVQLIPKSLIIEMTTLSRDDE